MRDKSAWGEEDDDEFDARSAVTPEELAELNAFLHAGDAPAEAHEADADRRAALFEDALKFWERSAQELRAEVRELRARVEQIELRQAADKPRMFPIGAEGATRPPEPEASLSRVKRYKQAKRRWFRF